MGNIESRGFAIAVFIITAILVGLLLADIIYFNQIRSGKQITQSEASSMLIFSIVLFVIVLGLWIWALVSIFFSSSTRSTATSAVVTKTTNFLTATDYGYTPQQVAKTVTMQPKTAGVGGTTVVTKTAQPKATVSAIPASGTTVVTQTRSPPPLSQTLLAADL